MENLSYLDLVFCVDLTASMEPFLQLAQRHMVQILTSLAASKRADLQVGLCCYRDYSQQEDPTQRFPLTPELATIQTILSQLQAYSPSDNLDAAEAVFAGLLESLKQDWRPNSYRTLVLVGDGPPHGCGAIAQPYPDRWPDHDPSGLSLLDLCNRLEGAGITLFALSMSPSVIPVHDPIMKKSFEKLALSTGGTYHDANSPDAAFKLLGEVSRRVFSDLDLDRNVFQQLAGQAPSSAQAEALSVSLKLTRAEIDDSLARLQKRKLTD